MSAELVRIPVTEDADILGLHDDGKNWAALRYMCDSLGINYTTQLDKLRRRSWATVSLRGTVAADGKVREMAMIDSETVPMWLATIDENRVSEEARPRLIAYQREAKHALDAYFNKRQIVAPAANQFDVLRAAIDQIEAAQRDAAEAKALAERNETRLDSIEGNHGWLTALGYARTNGLPTYEKFLARFSRHAGMIARSHDIEPNKVHHPHFGTVNSYPTWVWDRAAEGFGA
jgi:hypothetical protein